MFIQLQLITLALPEVAVHERQVNTIANNGAKRRVDLVLAGRCGGSGGGSNLP